MNLIAQIVVQARQRGLTQATLAKRAGVAKETLSRAKKRGSAHLSLVEDLARAAGVTIGVTGVQGPGPASSALGVSFRDHYRALVWSNPAAPLDAVLRAALLRPEYRVLLDAALELGVPRVECEWEALKAEGLPEVQRAAPVTERILGHIRLGYQQATA